LFRKADDLGGVLYDRRVSVRFGIVRELAKLGEFSRVFRP
jgi:hypothetical protein